METLDHTRTITQNAFLEIAKGNVPGSSIAQIVGRNTNVGKIHQDIWDGGILSTLDYDAQTVNYTVGDVITGATSGATATIAADVDNGATGTLYIRNISTTPFQNNEIVTDEGTGSALSNGINNQIARVHEPTSGESWEIICENANDTILGTGARLVLVTFMEEATRLYTNEIIALNGQTAVAFTSTDAFRFRSATVLTWGSATNSFAGKTNLGNIIIRDSVTKNVAGLIFHDISVPGDEHGLNSTFNSNYTVEAGVTAFPIFVVGNSAKDNDVEIETMGLLDGSEGYFFFGALDVYQNSVIQNIEGPAGTPEKITIKFVARSNNVATVVNSQAIFILVEND